MKIETKNPKVWLWAEGRYNNLLAFYCPACGTEHMVSASIHRYNNVPAAPTFRPSVLVCKYHGDTVVERCHSWVNDGWIQYLEDSTHAMKGQRWELPTRGIYKQPFISINTTRKAKRVVP